MSANLSIWYAGPAKYAENNNRLRKWGGLVKSAPLSFTPGLGDISKKLIGLSLLSRENLFPRGGDGRLDLLDVALENA